MSERTFHHMPDNGPVWDLHQQSQLVYIGEGDNGLPVYELTLRGYRVMDLIVDTAVDTLPIYMAKPGEGTMRLTGKNAYLRQGVTTDADGMPLGAFQRVAMSPVFERVYPSIIRLMAELYGEPVATDDEPVSDNL